MRANGFEPVMEERKRPKRTLADLAVTVWLTPENASFFVKNNFLYLRQGEEEQRVFLCRQFPFELQWEFISVMNAEEQEIGIIRNVELFDEENCALLKEELRRRYYSPVIDKIYSLKERYGFSYWKVHTTEGDMSFTLRDTFRSIIHAGGDRVVIMDVNGNRFEIPDVKSIDKKSYKKIELYL